MEEYTEEQYTRKEELLNLIEECIDEGMGLTLLVENDDMPLPETIYNPEGNLKYKADYIDSAYNDELKLKSNNSIKISDFYEHREELYVEDYELLEELLWDENEWDVSE